MDHAYEKHHGWLGFELPELPSFYFHRQVYATFINEDAVGLRERHTIGIDNIMWSSDYPHSDTTWPDSRRLTEKWFGDFPEDEKRKICCDNARRLHQL